MESLDLRQFRSKRRRLKRWGWIVFYGGMVLMLLDLTTSFPTPMRGRYALGVWLPIMGVGAAMLVLGYRLPLRETLLLADSYGGVLDVPTVVRDFNVDPDTARRILETACKKLGHGTHDDEATGNRFYVFHPRLDADDGVPAAPPA